MIRNKTIVAVTSLILSFIAWLAVIIVIEIDLSDTLSISLLLIASVLSIITTYFIDNLDNKDSIEK